MERKWVRRVRSVERADERVRGGGEARVERGMSIVGCGVSVVFGVVGTVGATWRGGIDGV